MRIQVKSAAVRDDKGLLKNNWVGKSTGVANLPRTKPPRLAWFNGIQVVVTIDSLREPVR